MKIKYIGVTPIRLGDIPLQFGDVLDLSKEKAEKVLTSKMFVLIKDEPSDVEKEKPATKSKAKKKAVEPTIETTEEEI